MTRVILPDGSEIPDPVEQFFDEYEGTPDTDEVAKALGEAHVHHPHLHRPHIDWKEWLHPRERRGRWIEVADRSTVPHVPSRNGQPERGARTPGTLTPETDPELVSLLDDLVTRWTEAAKTRKKGGSYVRSAVPKGKPIYAEWEPPETDWHQEGYTTSQGSFEYVKNIEYAPGKWATVKITGRHLGKQGEWKVRATALPWDRFEPETIALVEELRAISSDVDDSDKGAIEALVQRHDLLRIGDRLVPKHGDEAVRFKIDRRHSTVFAAPSVLSDSDRNHRVIELLGMEGAEGDHDALIGTPLEEIQDAVKYGTYGWTIHPVNADLGDYELEYRREGRGENAGEVTLKLLRLHAEPGERYRDRWVVASFGEATNGQERVAAEKQRIRAEADERNARVTAIAQRIKDTLAGKRETPWEGGEDWDEAREALLRLGFRVARRSNAGKGGWKGGYREVWRRSATGSTVTLLAKPDPSGREIERRFAQVGLGLEYGRPAWNVAMLIVPEKSPAERGELETSRERLGRLPETEDEWKQEILGRADELAASYGEETGAVLVTFAREGDDGAPPDMNAWIDSDGVIVLGTGVLPALLRYSEQRDSLPPADQLVLPGMEGEITSPIVADAWSAWATIQHEVVHSINRSFGWFGGYSDHDGTRNFEESLTEELARLIVNDWVESADEPLLAQWARGNAQARRVQGAYQTYRTAFRKLLDELGVPEDERYGLLERWKFHVSWQERMQEVAERLAEEHHLSLDDAKKRLRDMLTNDEPGYHYVDNFEPVLKVGPLPPPLSEEELEALRAEVRPLYDAFKARLAEWQALREEWNRARYSYAITGEEREDVKRRAEAALDAVKAAQAAYTQAIEIHGIAPFYEEATA